MSRKKFQKTYITFERRVVLEFTFFCVIDDVSKKDSSHFFQGKKMWGFHCDPSLPWTKGLEGKWFCHPGRIFYFHVKLWLAWLVLLYACFTLFFLTGFFCEKLMVVHLIDIRSSGWKVFPKIGSEYFFLRGVFPWKKKRENWKIPKWQESEIIFIWKMTTLEFQDFIVILRFLVKLLHFLSMLCCS